MAANCDSEATVFHPSCKSILIEQSSATNDRADAAYSAFLDEVYIPDVMEAAGVLGAQRFECVNGEDLSLGKYLTIFELSDAEPKQTLARIQASLKAKARLPGHTFREAKQVFSGAYRRVYRLEECTRPRRAVVGIMVSWYFGTKDASKMPDVHRWYNAVHVPDMLAVPGFCATDRLLGADTSEFRMLHFYQLDSENLFETRERMRAAVGTWMVKNRYAGSGQWDRRDTRMYRRKMPWTIHQFE